MLAHKGGDSGAEQLCCLIYLALKKGEDEREFWSFFHQRCQRSECLVEQTTIQDGRGMVVSKKSTLYGARLIFLNLE
jgi:hypothetical protein